MGRNLMLWMLALAAGLLWYGPFPPVFATTASAELSPEQIVALNKARAEGDSLFRQRKYREAIEAYRQATQVDSSYAPTYFNMGLSFQRINRESDAIRALKRAVAIDPKFGPAHLEIASVYLKQDSLEAAEQELRHTRRVFADSAQYVARAEQMLGNVAIKYTNRAVQAQRQRNYDVARADAERAIELAPEISRPFYVAALIDEAQNRYQAAQERYHLAVEKAEDLQRRADALGGIGRIYIALAREADRANNTMAAREARLSAVERLRESVNADSSNYSALINLGNTLFELDDYSGARDALIRAERLNSRDFKAPFKLAEVYMKLEQCAEAEQAANRAIQLQRANASAHATRAEALECLGRLNDAINEYEEAKRDPRWRQRAEYKIKKLREELGPQRR